MCTKWFFEKKRAKATKIDMFRQAALFINAKKPMEYHNQFRMLA